MVNKWIFPLNQKLKHEEWLTIKTALMNTLKEWNTHGKPIEFNLHVLHHQIIIVETLTPTSGCAIDSLQKKIRDVLNNFKLKILPNHYIFYLKNGELNYFDFRDTHQLIQNQIIDLQTPILDTQKILAGESDEFSILKESWLAKYC